MSQLGVLDAVASAVQELDELQNDFLGDGATVASTSTSTLTHLDRPTTPPAKVKRKRPLPNDVKTALRGEEFYQSLTIPV